MKPHYSLAHKTTLKTSQETQKHPKSTPFRPNCNGVSSFSFFKGIQNRSNAKTTAKNKNTSKHHYCEPLRGRRQRRSLKIRRHLRRKVAWRVKICLIKNQSETELRAGRPTPPALPLSPVPLPFFMLWLESCSNSCKKGHRTRGIAL